MSEPLAPPAGSAPGQVRRAVIVDDDQGLLRLVKNWLTGIGFEVDAFDQFEPAKRHLMSSTPQVLVTDVRLGAFNGLQLVVLAKLAHPEIVAIVLTGFEDPVLRKEAADAGAVYLPKPIRAEQLIDVIQTYTSVIS
jgi:DNA-binding NtrC family response regulator